MFENYEITQPYPGPKGRMLTIVTPEGLSTTMRFSRYLMITKLGRPLASWERVIHLDGNNYNDDFGNLHIQIVGADARAERAAEAELRAGCEAAGPDILRLYERGREKAAREAARKKRRRQMVRKNG